MLPLLLAACSKTPTVTTIDGTVSHVSVQLVNPTSCSYCDPFDGVDTLDVNVWAAGEIVATGSFAYPDETPTLPDLTGFGVVRIEMIGRYGGFVTSVGRTDEVVVDPDEDRVVTMAFLPVNEGLPLTGSMRSPRSEQVAWRRRDGTVLLSGGLDPARNSAYASSEVYDPESGRFSDGPTMPDGAGFPAVVQPDDDTWLLLGGQTSASTATTAVVSYSFVDDEFTSAGSLTDARVPTCASLYHPHGGMLFGGTTDADAEAFEQNTASGEWTYGVVRMEDFDQSLVTGCALLADGRTFLQGSTAAGVWNYISADDPGTAPGQSFGPLSDGFGVAGAVVRRVDDDRVWIAGGYRAGIGVTAQTWLFDPETDSFGTGADLGSPRYGAQVDDWLDPGWVVVGCGWTDKDATTPSSTIELAKPSVGGTSKSIPMDRDRDGCTVTTLRDGSVLVAGGHESADDGIDAAIVVPWMDED